MEMQLCENCFHIYDAFVFSLADVGVVENIDCNCESEHNLIFVNSRE